MASRRAYIRDERRLGGSPSDDEELDERGDQGFVRLPTLRSMIVRPNSDKSDARGDHGRASPLQPAFESPRHHRDDEATNKPTYSLEQRHTNSRSEENRARRADSGDDSGPAYGLPFSRRGETKVSDAAATGSEADERRGLNYRSPGEGRGRAWDGGHDSSIPDRDGGRRAGARSRDLEPGRDRAVPRRDASRSPRTHYRRDVEESGLHRRGGKKRELDKSPDENEGHDRYDDAETDTHESDVKGKARQRDGVWRERDGGGSQAHNHLRDRGGHYADQNSRRYRETSLSSGDRRNAEGGSRSPVAAGRNNNRAGRNGADWGRDRERDVGQDDVRNGRRDMGRGRDGGRGGRGGEAREAPVPELNSIHRATVHSIRPFGIFVRMDGFRNHGMVHLGQISHHEVTNRKDSDEQKVEAISSVVSQGDQVWVKVISVQHEEDGKVKVGCSLKLVSQGDGKDLDPNNLQQEKYQSKGPWQPPKKLELDAVYNVSCTRCGGHGHLKKECYSTGEKTYELLADGDGDDDDDGAGAGRSKAAAGVVPKKSVPAVGPSSMAPSGPAGRGRAMVKPAWMTHGVGVGGDQEKVLRAHHSSSNALPDLPEKVTSLEDALAVLEMAKEDKRKRRLERRHRKQRKRDKRHGSKERQKEKHKKRHRSEDDHHHRSKKKRRV